MWSTLVIFTLTTVIVVTGQVTPYRPIPLCITAATVQEYRQNPSQLLLDLVNGASTTMLDAVQTTTPTGGVSKGKLSKVTYGKILTNAASLPEPNAADEYRLYTVLNQWLHLRIDFSTNVKALVVQAVVNPYGLPWGVFDIEFACNDCTGGGINIEDGREGYALSYGGSAVVVPCTRRAYINPRHPYTYTYDGSPRKEFHLNFNYVDIPCRNMSMLQFLIISADDNSREYARTAVIDHINQDSVDGMPYPYHVRFYRQFSCHKESQNFKVVRGGDRAGITVNPDYDSCVQANQSDFEANYRDTQYYQSDWVCSKPGRVRCESYAVGRQNDPTHQNIGPPFQALCLRCFDKRAIPLEDAPATVMARSDRIRRFHGFCMVLGTVSISVVSIHVARYFKETRGCCLLIGWWFWVHLVLMYAATGAILTGLLTGIFMPPRIDIKLVPGLTGKRNNIQVVHIVFGVITAVICYPACCIVGPIRPRIAKKRMKMIWSHSVLGYLTVALGILSTYFSSGCIQLTLYEILLVTIATIPYIAALCMQQFIDFDKPLFPPRKYIPVLEAAAAQSPLPMAVPRAVVLGLLASVTLIFVILHAVYVWVEYKGAFGLGPCVNCLWKWDDAVEDNNGDSRPLWNEYGCDRNKYLDFLAQHRWISWPGGG